MNGMGIEQKIFHISSPDTADNGPEKAAVLRLREYTVGGQQPGSQVQPAEVNGLLSQLTSSSVK